MLQFNLVISYPIYHGQKNRLFLSFLYQPFTNLIFAIRSSLSHFSCMVHNLKSFILYFIGLLFRFTFWWNAKLKIGCRISAASTALRRTGQLLHHVLQALFPLTRDKIFLFFFYNFMSLVTPDQNVIHADSQILFQRNSISPGFLTAYFCCP